ncbi:MAG: DUF308 domain-containing protein, partial [Clostridiales bacterium]|nr:DUF308 domain-containing protein [Clostridiales bacterium]
MKRYKDTVTNVIGAICELLIGILLIISPVSFTSWIIIFIGIVLIIIGIVNIVEYFKSPPQVGVFERKLPIGILAVAG